MVKHIIDTRQFKDRKFLEGLFERSDEMRKLRSESGVTDKHRNKVVGGFFYQPSTRTRLSFQTAAQRIGANTVFTENARDFSSAVKGETLEHSLKATEEFVDAIVLRHEKEGAALRAAKAVRVPVINAGDGTNQHPTQALLDLYTLRDIYKRMDRLKVAFVGDVKHGRTVRSLAYLLAQLENNELTFVAPEELDLPASMRTYFRERGIEFRETDSVDAIINDVDALYVTRLQFEYEKEDVRARLLQKYRGCRVTKVQAEKMKDGAIIMHPLPINTDKSDGYPEIDSDVDDHSRARYFRQSNNGLYVRMALLDVLLTGDTDPLYNLIGELAEAA